MGWAKLDDQLTFHKKVVAAGNAAMGAWVRMLTWSSAHLSDGLVPRHIAILIASEQELVTLTSHGLLDVAGDDFQIHDYLEFNPSKAEVETERGRRSDWGKQMAARRYAAPDATPHADTHASQQCSRPDPSRPVPSHKENTDPKRGRKTFVVADWQPSDQTIAWCSAKGVDGKAMVEEFIIYWQSKAEPKTDWNATFKNSVNKKLEWGTAKMLPPPPPPPPKPIEIDPDALTGEAATAKVMELQAKLFNTAKR